MTASIPHRDRLCEAEFLLPKLSVTKAADTTELPADGGVVEYTITATNTGPGTYTAAEPARVTDDLSAVLDDATFGGITSPTDGSAELVGDELTWVGPLAAGESVTITYTATYDSAAGDNILYNLVCIPTDETAAGQDDCASVRIPAAELVIDKTVDPESGTAVDAGQVVTYTLSFASVGEAAAAVDKVDDLSDVLDDAELCRGLDHDVEPGADGRTPGHRPDRRRHRRGRRDVYRDVFRDRGCVRRPGEPCSGERGAEPGRVV